MTVDLTAEEMEMILTALKERVKGLREGEDTATEEASLVARLEVVERESRGTS
jgi:hypothetical protein